MREIRFRPMFEPLLPKNPQPIRQQYPPESLLLPTVRNQLTAAPNSKLLHSAKYQQRTAAGLIFF